MSEPAKRSVWRYVGPGVEENPTGEQFHRVLEVSSDGVVTWSRPSERAGIGGYSWFGPLEDFHKDFRHL